MRHHHLQLIREQSLLFLDQSDQDPTQPEFALLQKQKIAGLTRMLNHLAEHQYRWPEQKTGPLKNSEKTGSARRQNTKILFQTANIILLIGIKTRLTVC